MKSTELHGDSGVLKRRRILEGSLVLVAVLEMFSSSETPNYQGSHPFHLGQTGLEPVLHENDKER